MAGSGSCRHRGHEDSPTFACGKLGELSNKSIVGVRGVGGRTHVRSIARQPDGRKRCRYGWSLDNTDRNRRFGGSSGELVQLGPCSSRGFLGGTEGHSGICALPRAVAHGTMVPRRPTRLSWFRPDGLSGATVASWSPCESKQGFVPAASDIELHLLAGVARDPQRCPH